MSKIYINIDGIECIGNKGDTILEIANKYDIEIPTMCHNEKVEKYGSCGLCVVEVEGSNKLLRACSIEAMDNMVIYTNTEKVKKNRKTTLELLLTDHRGDCIAPCKRACPGETDCQGYVGLVANKQYREALELVKKDLPFPTSIGRVCPHPCEDKCRRKYIDEPISIANIKSFIGDNDFKKNINDIFLPEVSKNTGKDVAIIGGGPSGLTAAYYLLQKGHNVSIFDKMPNMGGMLRYGIPEYRLPKKVLDEEIDIIKKLGADFKNNIEIGRDISFKYIRDNYDAVYLGIGAWESSKLNIENEDCEGVIGGIDFLRKNILGEKIYTGKKVLIVGGGNTAMDACRTAKRLGAEEVTLLYRRSREEMPAEEIEIIEAFEEGIKFEFLVSPVKVRKENNKVKSLVLEKMKLEKDLNNGRKKPIGTGEFKEIDCDLIISAIGQKINLNGFEEVETNSRGNISVDKYNFRTNIKGVFAGGDGINKGADIAIKAIGDAKKAAEIIDFYLKGIYIEYKNPYIINKDSEVDEEFFIDWDKRNRVEMPHQKPEDRIDNFTEINYGYTEKMAVEEASRCLSCGCHDVNECKLFEYANEYDVEPEKYGGYKHKREIKDNHPFIKVDIDKCILCGLCVRVCSEVVDNEALGLVDRGFDTMMAPAMKRPLKKTSCISCGNCITTCPTGALQERQNIKHSLAYKGKLTKTICQNCSIGCNFELETINDLYFRNLPLNNKDINNGNACLLGRFGFEIVKEETRIKRPKLKKNNKLVDVSWEESLKYVANKLKSTVNVYGENSVALCIADNLSNEEIYLSKEIFKTINSDNIYCLNQGDKGIYESLGINNSTVSYNQIERADTVLLIGASPMKSHTVAGFKLNNMRKNGGKIYTFNTEKIHEDKWAEEIYKNEEDILKLEKALLDLYYKDNLSNLDILRKNLKDIKVDEDILNLAKIFKESSRGIIIVDEKNLSYEGQRRIANILLLSGKIDKPRNGLFILKEECNSQGLWNLGVRKNKNELIEKIENNEIKTLITLGEEIKDLNYLKIDSIISLNTFILEEINKIDAIIPLSMYGESKGSYINAEGRLQFSDKAIESKIFIENWKILNYILEEITGKTKYKNIEDIELELKEKIGCFKAYNRQSDGLEEKYYKIKKENIYLDDIDKPIFKTKESYNTAKKALAYNMTKKELI